MQPIGRHRKVAVCRRMARLTQSPEVARALMQLADDFEQAHLSGDVEPLQPIPRPKTVRKVV